MLRKFLKSGILIWQHFLKSSPQFLYKLRNWRTTYYTIRINRFLPVPQVNLPCDGEIIHRLVRYPAFIN